MRHWPEVSTFKDGNDDAACVWHIFNVTSPHQKVIEILQMMMKQGNADMSRNREDESYTP